MTTITTNGPFSLREAALFGFGHRDETSFDGVMRLAFLVDGDHETPAGVAVTQEDGLLRLDIESDADHAVVAAQVARILSVDHDATGFVDLGRRDPVIGALQAVAPGLRPVLFHSPYEAALWSVISARRPRAQAARLRERLGSEHGWTMEVAGRPMVVVPSPSRLRAVTELPGLPADRIPRLHTVAEAVVDGWLTAEHLTALGPQAASVEVQRLPGIGPFYATLVVVRGTGFVDVLPDEPRARALAGQLYALPEPIADDDWASFGERWAPWRTWAAVLVRAASDRLPDTPVG